MPSAEPRCWAKDCTEQGIWQPIFVIRPLGDPPSSTRTAKADAGFAFCQTHRESTDVDDLIGGAGWVTIVNALRTQGRQAPDPDVLLEWAEIPLCGYTPPGVDPPEKCRERIIENIILRYDGAGDEGKPVTIQIHACRLHYADVNRMILEQLSPDHVDRFSFVPAPTGFDLAVKEGE